MMQLTASLETLHYGELVPYNLKKRFNLYQEKFFQRNVLSLTVPSPHIEQLRNILAF